jgi:hypothetical protein
MPTYGKYGTLDSPQATAVDVAFLKMNARLRPDQLSPSEVAMSVNGRMDVDGSWQVRKGIDYLAGSPTSSYEALTLPFYVYANIDILTATRTTTTVAVTTDGSHGFVNDTLVLIYGLSGTVDPNGNRTATVTGADTFTFQIAGVTGSESYSVGGVNGAGAPAAVTTSSCFGACRFSDPSDSNTAYIIEAQSNGAVAIDLSDGSSTAIAYPSGITIASSVNMLQAFNKVYIFRDGATALEWDGDLGGGLAFTKVANGNYTQPTVFTAANNTAASGGVVTVTETAHGLTVGTVIKVFDAGSTILDTNAFYEVATVPGANSFTFYADTDDFSATSVVLGKAQSQGQGFTHMAAPPWGVYHQRRLITPFNYTTTGTSGSEVITDREVRDELLFSDVLDSDTYDVLVNNFRVTAGIADYVQTVHPFTDDNAVAFNRNSIHLIGGLSGGLNDLTINEITREAGLVARRSVVTIKNSIYFLSDNGIYAADFGDLYNLRGAGLPLSDPIQPLIDRINSDYASVAVAVYHNNRYWIAVPIDNSMVNNAMLVYNVLNGGWESLDIVNDNNWNVIDLIPSSIGGRNNLYAVSAAGGIHIIDSRVDDVDLLSLYSGVSAVNTPIEGELTTRSYTMGDMGRKRYSEFELHAESSSSNASDAVIAGIAENNDSEFTITTISDLLGAPLAVSEDASIRGRIGGKRAYSLQMKITPTQGRPKVRGVRVTATATFQSLSSAQ